jgi:hypothetical protein
MVTVLMGHQNVRELLRRAPEARQALLGFPAGETAIDHHQG